MDGKPKSRKNHVPPIVSKIDESYNTDKAPDTLTSKDDLVDNKSDRKAYLQDIPSENTSRYDTNKVRN